MIAKKFDKKGITLMELMAVVALIGIMAALAVPNFDGVVVKIRHKSAVRDVLGKTRMARSYAISRGTRWGVYINSPSGYYVSFRDVNNSDSYNTGDSLRDSTRLDPNLRFENCTFSNNVVIFKNDGSAVAGGYADLVNAKNSERTRINVTAAVGRVFLSTPP